MVRVRISRKKNKDANDKEKFYSLDQRLKFYTYGGLRTEKDRLLIDRSGLKGLMVGSASVSPAHANFICVDKAGGHANDVMRLVERVVAQVQQSQQVSLQTEVVFWRRGDRAGAMQ